MIKHLSLLLLSVACVALSAAAHITVKLGPFDAESQTAIIKFIQNGDGYWFPQQNFTVTSTEGIGYALDPKENTLYVKSIDGNYRVVLGKKLAAEYKKNDQLPKLTGVELATAVANESRKLEAAYDEINAKRTVQVQDSIAAVRRAEKERRESERQAREEAARAAEAERRSREAHVVPAGGLSFVCELCGAEKSNVVSMNVSAIAGRRIYHIADEVGPLGVHYQRMHVYPLRSDLEESPAFRDHMRLFRDELVRDSYVMTEDEIKAFNSRGTAALKDALTAKAPYGYLSDVTADCRNGNLAFALYYTNSSRTTVSKVEVELDYTDVYGNGRVATFYLQGPIRSFEGTEYIAKDTDYPCMSTLNSLTLTVTFADGSIRVLRDNEVIFDN